MATVWSQTIESNHYEVRSAGATLRLYRNGVHHSQWDPNRPLCGDVWDLIALPSLYRPKGSIEDALILGFGAGVVAQKLRKLVEAKHIVGIDLDPIHLSVAKEFFECTKGCELIAADAIEWLQKEADNSDALKFDLIIDDLFTEDEGCPVRSAPMDLKWCQHLAKLVKPDGILVFNAGFPFNITDLALLNNPMLRQQFPHAAAFCREGSLNYIVAASRRPLEEDVFNHQLKDICLRYPLCRGVQKHYNLFNPFDEIERLNELISAFASER